MTMDKERDRYYWVEWLWQLCHRQDISFYSIRSFICSQCRFEKRGDRREFMGCNYSTSKRVLNLLEIWNVTVKKQSALTLTDSAYNTECWQQWRRAVYRIHKEHATSRCQIDADSTGFEWQEEDRWRAGVSVGECFNGSCTLLAGHRSVKTRKMKTIVSKNTRTRTHVDTLMNTTWVISSTHKQSSYSTFDDSWAKNLHK